MQLHDAHRSAAVFAALGDATRLGLLQRLAGEERSISDLAAGSGMSRQAVTKHLHVLARTGLVRGARCGRERRFRADVMPLAEATAWLHDYRRQWEESFDRLEEHLQSLVQEKSP